MNSSRKQPDPAPDPLLEPALVREAGVSYRPCPAADPFERWLDLMEVVEALCPRWPVRTAPPVFDVMRL